MASQANRQRQPIRMSNPRTKLSSQGTMTRRRKWRIPLTTTTATTTTTMANPRIPTLEKRWNDTKHCLRVIHTLSKAKSLPIRKLPVDYPHDGASIGQPRKMSPSKRNGSQQIWLPKKALHNETPKHRWIPYSTVINNTWNTLWNQAI